METVNDIAIIDTETTRLAVTKLHTEGSEVQNPVRLRDFSLFKTVQTGSGVHTASLAGNGFLFRTAGA
jgi:hypothetical protein